MSVVSTAQQYLGTPYVWGGTTPSGFDCSGLVQYSFAQNGITIPRTSQEQFKYTANSRITNANQLQAGDLVFFKGSTGSADAPGHVGLYIGNGQYIHAPKTGDVVKVSNLADRKDFLGGGRVNGAGGGGVDLNGIGKVFAFLILLGLGILAVVMFVKAFDIPTNPVDAMMKALKSSSSSTTTSEKSSNSGDGGGGSSSDMTEFVESVDDDLDVIGEIIKGVI